jgi:hypothetical protein
MLFVLAGWVLFRASSFGVAGSLLLSLLGVHGSGHVEAIPLLAAAALVSALVPSAHEIIDGFRLPFRAVAVAGGLLAICCLLEVGRGAPVNFIYFQF